MEYPFEKTYIITKRGAKEKNIIGYNIRLIPASIINYMIRNRVKKITIIPRPRRKDENKNTRPLNKKEIRFTKTVFANITIK